MKRVATAVVLIPAVVWAILAAPYAVFITVVMANCLLAFHEFDNIAAASGIRRASWPGMVAGVTVLLAPNVLISVVLTAILGLCLAMRAGNLRATMAAAGAFTLGVIYIFGAWRCADALHAINPHWLLFAMLINWAGDTAAYYVGRSIGKHKLAPRVSPGKTWEGTIGSVAGAAIAGAIYAHYLIPAASLALVLVLAIAGNIAGQLGDLSESALKRGAGVKDSGTILPGHGGWLDRIDSALFGIPVVYGVLAYFGI